MKGKNKLVFVMFAILVLVATGVCFMFAKRSEDIKYVSASSIPGYTANLDGVIFSAERVYYAEQKDARDKPLRYGSNYLFNRIETGEGTRYFGDIKLTTDANYDNKDVIYDASQENKYDGDYVIVDDQKKLTATNGSNSYDIKQGIMITFGGYYFKSPSEISTNATTGSGDEEIEHGADISFVNVSATLNGKLIEKIPNARDFNSTTHKDFTWFIDADKDADKSNEGHYVISFTYMRDGKEELHYDFDFYLLLSSNYRGEVEISKQKYERSPKIERAEQNNNSYSYHLGEGNFPTLTFDYERYDVSITHSSGDVTKTIEFDYEERALASQKGKIKLTTSLHNTETVEEYSVPNDFGSIVTLMFTDNGKYTFNFQYIYKNGGVSAYIPKEQESIDSLTLDIYGYQLKYSKAGVISADMEYLEIYQNKTMFILLNGYTSDTKTKSSDNLGVNYKLVSSLNEKTGKIKEQENAVLSEMTVVTDSIVYPPTTLPILDSTNTLRKLIKETADGDNTCSTALNELLNRLNVRENNANYIGYQKTDRGIWFALNDKYNFSENGNYESFYYHSQEPIGIDDLIDSNGVKDSKPFTKVTTFTEPGYYLVQLSYHDGKGNRYQYYAFQITSATPILNLYKTDLSKYNANKVVTKLDPSSDNPSPINTWEFYAYEFTNKNVYANWRNPDIFESTINGKLYYSITNVYETEDKLRAVADGKSGVQIGGIVSKNYDQNTIITDSASYLLVLEVGGTATKTYTYFTIDKADISGLTVYEMGEGYIDGNLIYRIKTKEGREVTHTQRPVIDVSFGLSWDDKASRAKITAKYRYTPFVKTNVLNEEPITDANAYYKYIINEYNVGTTTGEIGFDKVKNSLSADNVMVGQGVYEFMLEDQAGNKLSYIVILDQTEAVVKATYGESNGESKAVYTSGQLVADFVEMDWGTHKAIDLEGVGAGTTIALLIDRASGINVEDEDLFKYYSKEKSNLDLLVKMFKTNVGVSEKNLLVVENEYADIRIAKVPNPYYRLKSVKPSTALNPEVDEKATIYEDGSKKYVWDDETSKAFVTTLQGGLYKDENYDGTASDLKILVNPDRAIRYMIEVKGANNVSGKVFTQFAAYITSDKTLGQVYSSSSAQQGVDYATRVETNDQNASFNGKGYDAGDWYSLGQASDNGVFVFEWTDSDQNSGIKVTEIKYDYYRLMSQDELNHSDTIAKLKDANTTEDNPLYYYPYEHARTDYILAYDKDNPSIQTVKEYDENVSRKREGETDTSTVNRSNPINVGVEMFYGDDGNPTYSSVTLTGLYIITRTIQVTEGEGDQGKTDTFSYAFFVDRNAIISYSINDIKDKLVGQFIHAAMPNTKDPQGVKFDNFAKQGVDSVQVMQEDGGYAKIYLETNKLPTRLNVPTGKYVSGNANTMEILHTSSLNMELKLTVYFYDWYKILPEANNYKGSTIAIMEKKVGSKGYINFDLNTEDARVYKNARGSKGVESDKELDNRLSLPGVYIFVINDRVGIKLNEAGKVTDYNKEMFAIKLLNQAPKTDVYAYAKIGGNESSKKYSEDLVLYTNQQYVDFVIPMEDVNSYMAQLDIGGVEVYRTDKNDERVLWLKLIYDYSTTTLGIDSSGEIKDNPNNKYLELVDDKYWVIKLDTGLEIDKDGKISGFEEYEFEITIQYILENSAVEYYTYTDANKNEEVSFYSTTYKVIIDRTPNETNLQKIIDEKQNQYFSEYQTWLAEENNTTFDGDINSNFAYRDKVTSKDYYGLTNKLYYEYIGESGTKSNQAMYAITIDEDTTFYTSGLDRLYWRKISPDVDTAQARMGLLPINDAYFNATATEYYGFTEAFNNSTAYTMASLLSKDNATYKSFVKPVQGESAAGTLYEFVEIDLAGNYTQYVVYFKLDETPNMSIKVNAIKLGGEGIVGDYDVELTAELRPKDVSFTSYNYVGEIKNVAKAVDGGDAYYPFYGKINVYSNSGKDLEGTIYLNTDIIHTSYDPNNKKYTLANSVEEQLNELIKNEGNYKIEYINNLNEVTTAAINVYTSSEHSLNVSQWKVKKTASGEYYLDFSELNTRVSDNSDVWWFVTNVDVIYNNGGEDQMVRFTASLNEGESVLDGTGDELVELRAGELNRLYLKKGVSYRVEIKDVAEARYYIPISTIENYVAYQLTATGNSYSKDDILYTVSDVIIEYDSDSYDIDKIVYNKVQYNDITGELSNVVKKEPFGDKRAILTLLADLNDDPDKSGSAREFEVYIKVRGSNVDDASIKYRVIIDTYFGGFQIKNLNNETYIINDIKSTINVGGLDAEGKVVEDYKDDELIQSKYYNLIISETINISWTINSKNNYFKYEYELYEFEMGGTPKSLLDNPTITSYQISPKDNTTGKYIFKMKIKDIYGNWMATRVYGIMMSTTMTGLYTVTYKSDTETTANLSAVTNWTEVAKSLKAIDANGTPQVAVLDNIALAFDLTKRVAGQVVGDYDNGLKPLLTSFGDSTAIPLYIANEELVLNSNKDNGVDSKCYEYEIESRGTKIKFYRVWRSNYQTFVVLMEINASQGNILETFKFHTQDDINAGSGYDLKANASTTIYDANAECYKLEFNSYYPYSSDVTPLEKHNKILITVSYAGDSVGTIIGGNDPYTSKEFNNSGRYTLEVRDIAGNKQKIDNSDSVKLVLMRRGEMLYTMTSDSTTGGKAPIKYAYYDKPVTLNIDHVGNYIGSSISVQVFRNSSVYAGYEHPTGSGVYVFKEYGTYLVRMSAKLANVKDAEGRNVDVSTETVFTILNPNEARRALDFTAIYGYDIYKVESINNGLPKDVTEKFMTLLNDKVNGNNVDVYNKLITYERVVELFGSSIKGKMKFRVLYKVQDDELLPARFEEFSFTLNNQTATLNVSIEPGGKTTKPVTIKFNAANIYELVGDCYIVVNGEKLQNKIDASAPNTVTELTISAVGEYYVQLVGDSGNVITTFNFTIKEPMNSVSIILIVVVSALVIGLVATFIWLRTRMKVR